VQEIVQLVRDVQFASPHVIHARDIPWVISQLGDNSPSYFTYFVHALFVTN